MLIMFLCYDLLYTRDEFCIHTFHIKNIYHNLQDA